MKELWNEICYELRPCLQNNVLEKAYENALTNCLAYLGWKKYNGEITTQYPIQVGHEKKYADIVVSKDGIEQFVLEVKRPNHVLLEEDKKQLFSYMRLLKHPVCIGLYVGDKIRLFYDEHFSEPIEVFSVEFSDNNIDGIRFIELFSKQSFSIENICQFCKEQEKRLKEKELMNIEVQKILQDKDGSVFKKLLKEKYLSEGFSTEWAENVIKQFSIQVKSPLSQEQKQDQDVFVNVPVRKNYPSKKRNSKDKTLYSFLGGPFWGKGRFVLEVVRFYVKSNPKTYYEYTKVFNTIKTDSLGIINTLQFAIENLQKDPKERFFMQDENILQSIDGVKFVVCREWGIHNIHLITDFANRQGYSVTSYNPKQTQ